MHTASYIWHRLFAGVRMPKDGIVIEIAPGYEPKIGEALAAFDFSGTVFLVEPDRKAAEEIQKTYAKLLPRAAVRAVVKTLQEVRVGIDIPEGADVVAASHPFDDMVISLIAKDLNFFSQEREGGTKMSFSEKNFYCAVSDGDYTRGIKITVSSWKKFIDSARPKYFMASQYPSRTLILKDLKKRQISGFAVLKELKSVYKNFLIADILPQLAGFKGNPKWWILAKNPSSIPTSDITRRPLAMKRLGKHIFVAQRAKRLHPDSYDVIYAAGEYFGNADYESVVRQAGEFAVTLDNKSGFLPGMITTYADRQKDKTGIALTGNLGSGRAVYCGDVFNILGVGKTTLCKSTKPSHSTGRLELIGAMRRIVLSKWINFFTERAPEHPLLIALKETAVFKWNPNPVPLALLLRIDNGSLDRPSHVEQNPDIQIDFQKTLTEYAKLDAEYLAYRLMLGAWSAGNYSLNGHVIDLESASFVKYRGPYYTSSSNYLHNRFGYEGLGFLKILHQLAEAKNINSGNIEGEFYMKRRRHLGYCFLLLLGVDGEAAADFFSRHPDSVLDLSGQFEKLSKKISRQKGNLNLYMPISEEEDPSLLDMSGLFRNLTKLYTAGISAEKEALKCLMREGAFPGAKRKIFAESKKFIHSLFVLLDLLDAEKCFEDKIIWEARLRTINQNMPTMYELNNTLRSLAESYRRTEISPEMLGEKIKNLCELPNLAFSKVLSKN